jgi:hypothetical protein
MKKKETAHRISAIAQLVPAGPVRYAIIALAFGVMGFHLLTGIDAAPFHGDEAWWSSSGYYYTRLMFIDHDYTPASWSNKGYWEFGLLSPPAGKYFIGLAMHASLPAGAYYYPYDFSKSETANREQRKVPPPEVLRPGRMMSGIAGFTTCLAVFLVCAKSWDWVVGLLASLTLAFNRLFTLFAHRAMTDSFLVLFLVLSVLCSLYLVQFGRDKPVKFLMMSVVAGLVAGICISVKFNGAVTLLVVGLSILSLMISVKPRNLDRLGLIALGCIVSVGFAILAIIALNPMFYTTSVAELMNRAGMVLNGWTRLLGNQQKSFPGQAIIGFPGVAINRMVADYYHPVLSLLAIVGAARVLTLLWRYPLSAGTVPLLVVAGSSVMTIVAVMAWIPLDWDRYYLPMVAMAVPLSAYGMVSAADFLYLRMGRKRPHPAPAGKVPPGTRRNR